MIHCAWYVNHSDYVESVNNISCLTGVTNIALGAVSSGVKKFIGIGTCLEYKDPFTKLKKELIPNSLYASSKLSAYFLLTQIFKNTATEFLWCRLYYLYGDGEKSSRLVPYLRRQIEDNEFVAINDPNKNIDILEISVAANMIVKAALGINNGAIDIRSGRVLTVSEFAAEIAKEMGKEWLMK